MRKFSIIPCEESAMVLLTIMGTILWGASCITYMLLRTTETVTLTYSFYAFFASSLSWALLMCVYMSMTAAYLDRMMGEFVGCQRTFAQEGVATRLSPYNSPFGYGIVTLLMGGVSFAVSIWACSPCLTPSPGSHFTLHIAVFIYLFFILLPLWFTLVRYKVMKRLRSLLPAVREWNSKDCRHHLQNNLDHDDVICIVAKVRNFFK